MFWWYYKSPYRTQDPNNPWPVILWLQSGPGASGVGTGNFEEVGPLDSFLKPRNSTWLKLIFGGIALGDTWISPEDFVVILLDLLALERINLIIK
ncbi:putative carboxypeptidase C [Helianthus debilis subsp. tardiflorus]